MTVAAASRLRFYTVEQIGPKMHRTPEGFLICEDVPIARTGDMLYGAHELRDPETGNYLIDPGPDGLVKITRNAEEVFHPNHIKSCIGKPIVNEHHGRITPENWREFTGGSILNPRRGTGVDSDLLLADLQITDLDLIEEVLAGKRAVSNGYSADYEQTAPGEGIQKNLLCNHLAIVAKGRCGARCEISDHEAVPQGATVMNKLKIWLDSIRAAIAANDTAKLGELAAQAPMTMDSGEIHIHSGGAGASKWNDEALEKKFGEHEKMIGDCKSTMDSNHKMVMDSLAGIAEKMKPSAEDKEIEGELKEEAPAGTTDAALAQDSAFLQDSYQSTVAMAEIVAPGLHIPTFDKATDPKVTFRNICGLRRKALQLGNNDSETNGIIERARGGRKLTSDGLEAMKCMEVRTLFNAVATIKREKNNAAAAGAGVTEDKKVVPVTPASINEANRAFYGQK